MAIIVATLKLLFFFVLDFIKLFLNKIIKISIYLIFIFAFLCYIYLTSNIESDKSIVIRIPKSATFISVKKIFDENHLIDNSILFEITSRLLDYDRNIRSGEFKFLIGLNSYAFVKSIMKSKPILRKITIVEGLRYASIADLLALELSLDREKFQAVFKDTNLLEKYDINKPDIEGYIFPQTYHFEWGISEKKVIDYLINKTFNLLNKHREKIESLKMDFNQILTLASIIEAESNFPDEMPVVSSVYHNRLNRGWKLEADPTILYILGKSQRVLFKHLKIKSPYNTYLYHGLPPAPINNPGKDAIQAAIYPEKTDYYFFTGTGDGTGRHLFGKTYKDHNQNRKQLDAARKKKNKLN